MSSMSFLQRRVFKEAKARLQRKPWYSGVCMDNFPTDQEIQNDFEGSVVKVEMNTAYWDAPGSMG